MRFFEHFYVGGELSMEVSSYFLDLIPKFSILFHWMSIGPLVRWDVCTKC